MTWKDSYTTHVESIDKQHKKQISLINDLHDSFANGRNAESVTGVLLQLNRHFIGHFEYEEGIFRKHGYRFEGVRKKQHQARIRRINDFRSRLGGNEEKVGEELLDYLLSWLGNHLDTEDRQYILFMLEKGIK